MVSISRIGAVPLSLLIAGCLAPAMGAQELSRQASLSGVPEQSIRVVNLSQSTRVTPTQDQVVVIRTPEKSPSNVAIPVIANPVKGGIGQVTFLTIADPSSNQVFSTPPVQSTAVSVQVLQRVASPAENLSRIQQSVKGTADMQHASKNAALSKDAIVQMLVSGRVVLDASHKPLVVHTTVGQVSLSTGSKAFISLSGRKAEIAALVGGQDSVAVVSPSGDEIVRLASGDALLIPGDEELISCEMHNTPVEGGLIFAGRRAIKKRINVAQYALSEFVVAGATVRVSGNSCSEKWRRPQAQVVPIYVQSQREVQHAMDPATSLIEASFVPVKSPSDTRYILVNASEPLAFDAGFARCEAAAGAFFLLAHNGASLRVINCHGDVKVVMNGSRIPVRAGCESYISNAAPSERECLPADGVARRDIRMASIGSKYLTLSDFEFRSLAFNSLYASSVCKALRANARTMQRVLKTAVALRLVIGGKGNYTVAVEAPDVTTPALLAQGNAL